MKTNTNLGLVLIRFSVGALMLLHGIAKIGNTSFIEEMLADKGLPVVLAYGVYITEIVAPLLILIGFRTRLAAGAYVFGILFIIFLVHSQEVFTLNKNGGWAIELLGLYLFGALALFFTGGGKYSVSTSNAWD
ncbi:DoxX family protein [Flavobacterium sp. F-380]|uniref:DoxX family protein n=1 Tax=Flavobacterium kayseriense TaxID=2764714 RepID=A0ABR7J7W0_9FLAO|nr:DoxX family protein [Flavobacterium kayseriense]MBC5841625.1 DoxX family protein [Flavobacterium kayseriense]MBC5848153.1 DoxX family protein [Flavobacterium kayseriense]MBU0942325.1 DoxX family protein [Bacteroidota bacterium]